MINADATADIAYEVDRALEAGATEDEVREVVEQAIRDFREADAE